MTVGIVEGCVLDVVRIQIIDEFSIGDLIARRGGRDELESDRPNDDSEEDEDGPAGPPSVAAESTAVAAFAWT